MAWWTISSFYFSVGLSCHPRTCRNVLRSHVFTGAFKLNMIEPGGCLDRAFQVPSVHEHTLVVQGMLFSHLYETLVFGGAFWLSFGMLKPFFVHSHLSLYLLNFNSLSSFWTVFFLFNKLFLTKHTNEVTDVVRGLGDWVFNSSFPPKGGFPFIFHLLTGFPSLPHLVSS